jgi:acetaldehyde dehydrogenase/alcohol dehydrogenase
MSKNLTENYPIVDTVEALEERLAGVREAQRIFATYTQEQVDKIFTAAALAANKARIPLAKLAVEETGMGIVEDKVIKNHYASEYIYNAYRDTKTCGVIEEDKAYGIKKVAEPIGVVAAVIPTTNPTSTAIFKTLISLKTRNGIIISPHPRAKKSTIAAAKVVLEAAVAAGAPEGIIGWIDVPSLELTDTLMKEADIILATGGPGMVKAAYSSGKPALGVGAGNTPAIIDESADVILAVNSIIHSKTFDNGMICASEQSVIVDKKVYKAVKEEFAYRGCYFLNKSETEKVRKTIIINGALNAKIVGQKAHTIAALAGVTVPEETKILIGEVTSVDLSEEFAHEKLSPVLAMYKAEDFEDALSKAEHLIADGGFGHTSSLYINVETQADKIAEFSERMKTCRCLINTPSSHGGIGDLYNFKMAPSLTLGCGSWGRNSVSENVGVKHLLNVKTVAERRENMLWFRAPEKVYMKRGCLPVALEELKNVMNKKRVFIVTDTFLYENGYTKVVTDKLDEMGIVHETFFNVAPDPTLACAKEGAKLIDAFKPDCIIAIGGGSAMDAAKIMWVLYEHPEIDFLDMAMRFMDIRKRVYTFGNGKAEGKADMRNLLGGKGANLAEMNLIGVPVLANKQVKSSPVAVIRKRSQL